MCILTDDAGFFVFERVQLRGYLVDEPRRVPSALGEFVGHLDLDRGGPQEPLDLAHGELDQPVPLGVVGPLFRGELERPGRAAAVVALQPDDAHVVVEPVRVAHEEVVEAGQGACLEALGHVALQTGPVGRRQVRVRVLFREAAQPVEQVLAVPVRAGVVATRGRTVLRGGRVRERHGLASDRRRGHQQQRRRQQRLQRLAVRLHPSVVSVKFVCNSTHRNVNILYTRMTIRFGVYVHA